MKNKRIAKNTMYIYILTFSSYFIGLLLYPYISRVLSVENFGLVGFSMSFVLIFQVIVEFGFMISSTALISKNRDDKEEISKIISTTMLAKILLSIVSLTLFLICALFMPMIKENFLIVFIFFINSVLVVMLPDFFFRGIEQMRVITVRAVGVRMFSLLLVVLLVRGDSQVMLVPASLLIGNVVALFIALSDIKKRGINVNIKNTSIKEAIISIKEAFLFFLSRLAVSINQSLGSFFLGLKFLPNSFEMGIFSGTTRLSSACEMLSPPLVDSIYPHMVKTKDYKLFKKVLIIGCIAWITVLTIGFIFAELICTIVLGKAYIASSKYLRILLIGLLFSFPNTMFGYAGLTPIGKAKHANIALLISASINVITCLVLWFLNQISLTSICIVMAMSSFTSLIYRGSIFYKNRKLIHSND